MFLLNKTEFEGVQYKGSMVTGKFPLKKFDLPEGYYGGRAKHIGSTNEGKARKLYVLLDRRNEVVDIIVTDPSALTMEQLYEIAARKKLDIPEGLMKKEVAELVGSKLSL